MSHEETWDKKRAAFFATNPKCKECGEKLDHYCRILICRKCRKEEYLKRAQAKAPEYRRRYVKKHKKKIKIYQAKYYLGNREKISMRKKIKYQEKRGADV